MADWQKETTREDAHHRTCIVLVHGFTGHESHTWGEFPKLLAQDPSLQSWDIHSFGYKTSLKPDLAGIWQGDPSIQTIADSFGAFAATHLERYQGIALIAHSMGGLVVQRALLDHEAMTKRVDKVLLFGTPSFGLIKAWPFGFQPLRWLNRQVSDMARNGPFIQSLREHWSRRFEDGSSFDFLAVAGSEDEFVPRSASIEDFPDALCAVVPGNHLEIVKPQNADDASLHIASRFIADRTLSGIVDSASLALERRQFHEVVERLVPNRAGLDSRALVTLALALDALGRRQEAIEALGSADRQGTDAMGVLAGRHKRNWIQDRQEIEARTATELYRRAYEQSLHDDDASQASYHGINLAFLALVFERDLQTARELAREALQHCQRAKENELPQQRMWRRATEGEAHLILGDLDGAVARYRSSLTGPPRPEPWQLVSTSQQAFRIVDVLGDETMAVALSKLFGGDPTTSHP